MKFGSVCSGIEAASVAFHPLGWEAAWLSEIADFPSSVLAHHYPNIKNVGDMMQIAEYVERGTIDAPDMLCGGTPCQSFSLSGLRRSMQDDRGNLTLEFVRIADAIDIVRNRDGNKPAIILWENVPGVLNTADNAFGCFLSALVGNEQEIRGSSHGGKWANAGIVVGPRRTAVWRILDAQYFGLAQRRKRVFVVASARDDIDVGQVLFEFDGMQRHTAPRRGSRETDSSIAQTGITDNVPGSDRVADRSIALAFKVRGQGTYTGARNGDPTKLGQHGGAGMISYEEKTFTLATNQDQFVAQINTDNQDETRAIGINGRIIGRQPQNGGQGIGFHEEVSYTLTVEDKHAVAIAKGSPTELDWQDTYGVDFQKPKVGFNYETAHTLQTTSYESVFHPKVSCAVRRLTPVECERLQGFPDGYTDVVHNNRNASDAARYRALGNSWAVNVVRWIGERIQQQIGDNRGTV